MTETPEQVLEAVVKGINSGNHDLLSYEPGAPFASWPVTLAAKNADVLRRQPDGSWRFVIDNP